jgi:hypothetical protein
MTKRERIMFRENDIVAVLLHSCRPGKGSYCPCVTLEAEPFDIGILTSNLIVI